MSYIPRRFNLLIDVLLSPTTLCAVLGLYLLAVAYSTFPTVRDVLPVGSLAAAASALDPNKVGNFRVNVQKAEAGGALEKAAFLDSVLKASAPIAAQIATMLTTFEPSRPAQTRTNSAVLTPFSLPSAVGYIFFSRLTFYLVLSVVALLFGVAPRWLNLLELLATAAHLLLTLSLHAQLASLKLPVNRRLSKYIFTDLRLTVAALFWAAFDFFPLGHLARLWSLS
ncbi:hypothetical protein JCM10213_003484 [Rhodosporidiobolus nylandii]